MDSAQNMGLHKKGLIMRKIKYPAIGSKYGRWTVVARDQDDSKRVICHCECGSAKTVNKYELMSGRTNSCGCINVEITRERSTTHGMNGTRLYYIWMSMKARCSRKNNNDYKNYGARGIRVCDNWLRFIPFKEWALSNGYSDNLTIDRIDSNKCYEPNNCRWATNLKQQNNKRNNITMTYMGKTKTMSEWARYIGLPYRVIKDRRYLGWSDSKILQTKYIPRGQGR